MTLARPLRWTHPAPDAAHPPVKWELEAGPATALSPRWSPSRFPDSHTVQVAEAPSGLQALGGLPGAPAAALPMPALPQLLEAAPPGLALRHLGFGTPCPEGRATGGLQHELWGLCIPLGQPVRACDAPSVTTSPEKEQRIPLYCPVQRGSLWPTCTPPRDSPLKAREEKAVRALPGTSAGTSAAKTHVEPGSWPAPTSGPLPHQHQGPGLHPQALHV